MKAIFPHKHHSFVAERRTSGLRAVAALAMILLNISFAAAQITIRGNVYGGGNRGDLLGTTAVVVNDGTVEGDVYGGARMANVTPDSLQDATVNGVTLSKDYATHVLIWGGTVNNVYGGNDITGDITGGTNVEIYSNVGGDVYGGGNGSYVYTDNAANADQDVYYNPGSSSIDSLNNFRPNVDNTLVHITGKSEEKRTYIAGRVFCGGNSATLRATEGNPKANLKIGSYVVADNVFLGSNGENMVKADVLQSYTGTNVNSINLTDKNIFEKYMRGVEVEIMPTVSFDDDYVGGTAYIGSFFVGGNRGSMSASGTFKIDFPEPVIIYNKLVGGCNDANVVKSENNAYHEGGLVTQAESKVELNIDGLLLEPRKLVHDTENDTYSLEWNKTAQNMLIGGNIYGGCYQSGYINGGVNINLKADMLSADTKTYTDGENKLSDNTLLQTLAVHRDSVLNTALSVFGAGYGEDSEVWGNTTINLTDRANIVKVFGGGEMGVVGNLTRNENGTRTGAINNAYNTTINLTAGNVGKIYGGGFEGPVTGHTTVNLVGGMAYDVIGGACNADIQEYAETYVGNADRETFPTVTNNIYGANDFGGIIHGTKDYTSRVSETAKDKVYNNSLLHSGAYVEYVKGTANYIFGGAKASYDYKYQPYYSKYADEDGKPRGGFSKPFIGNAFVNFSPVTSSSSSVARVYGGSQGYFNEIGKDLLQSNSYVLVDIPTGVENFARMEVFGAGDYSGVGMDVAAATVSEQEQTEGDVTAAAVVDLARGHISSVYGGSYKEGFTRRTIVNVPQGSTIEMSYLYGGAYGVATADDNELGNLYPCDVYESNVNYNSEEARCRGIYGGNNAYRRTLYAHVNIHTPVRYYHNTYGMTHATIFGAGYGENTWAQYTEVNLLDGARVYEVYGGGEAGCVYNKETITARAASQGWNLSIPGDYDAEKDGGLDNAQANSNQLYADYKDIAETYKLTVSEKYNANVHIHRGATVANYAYGAGLGNHKEKGTSAVCSGTSYIDLLGGTVTKDLYAAGTIGAVQDTLMLKSFTASSTAYVKGGQARNIYGGGWEGPVGKHDMSKAGSYLDEDVLGETHVIVGRPEGMIAAEYAEAKAADPSLQQDDFYFYNGVPAILRNAYAGGEGGVVRGTANLDILNGLVGYSYKLKDDISETQNNYYKVEVTDDGRINYTPMKEGTDLSAEDYIYVEELDQDAVGDNILFEAGNAFGGGYAANSDVDIANLTLWNGIIRNSLYGGGEIATIGRGTQTKNDGIGDHHNIYKAGETHVTMWGGHVLRDVFGGGRGFDNWKTEDKSDGNTNGYVYGQTDVNIHFGTVGTPEGLASGYGNIFGGGNVGFVYSQHTKGTDGWYYEDVTNHKLSEDTRVEVKAYGKALEDVTIGGTTYAKGAYIPNTALDLLGSSDADKPTWAKVDQSGITIYNSVFAGGNVSAGSDKIMAFSTTVYGNSTAAVVDIFNRDLVSVGGKGVGGLYGDGNLTFVDGYRELNITNYGTDFYTLSKGVSDDVFNELTPRQQSFYTTQYECNQTYGDYYVKGDVVQQDVFQLFSEEDQQYWTRKQSIVNEGRFINTVQRCDFCGIKGSRLVLHGAIDRAQDESEADYTNYTINRVGELSLNQNKVLSENHGSYFGIYNVVKYLGGVTSDVPFDQVRTTNSATSGNYAADGSTYRQWKQAHLDDNMRNDGSALNKIALSSGVYLEIVKELDTSGNKVYGPITGVVELDLLNVTPGEGGGFVYAKNIHGTPSHNADNAYADVISDANQNLVTNRAYSYSTATESDRMQSSGNFIHSLPKRILDDCFPEANSYAGANASPAHYWYIRGDYYVYEQLVSAYTGTSDSYSTELTIPLTMAIQGNARLRLLNVVPGLYADPSVLSGYTYNADDPSKSVSDSISIVNNAVIKSYGQGDPISYWDWYNAGSFERSMFVEDGTVYVCNEELTVNGTTYYPGQAIDKKTYDDFGSSETTNEQGETVKVQSLFSIANEVSRDNGYLLTIDLSNPSKWDDYYSLIDGTGSPIKKIEWEKLTDAQKALYVKSATFSCKASGTYGQYSFSENEIISKPIYDMETETVRSHVEEAQATFDAAYMAKDDCVVSVNGVMKSYSKGTAIPASVYSTIADAASNFERAYVCVSTVLVATGDYRVLNQLVGATEYDSWSDELKQNFQPAYYCTQAGAWGGQYYEDGKKYNAVDYGQLSEEERTHFTFDYDALDALLYNKYVTDHSVGASKYDRLSEYNYFVNQVGGTNRNNAITVFDGSKASKLYSTRAAIEYTATFNSENADDEFTYTKDGENQSVSYGTKLNNDQFESLPNDRKYYASFAVSDSHKTTNDLGETVYRTYIVNNTFERGGEMYNAGKAITESQYSDLTTTQQGYVTKVEIPETNGSGTYFFCIDKYTVGANDGAIAGVTTPTVVNIVNAVSYPNGSEVPVGTVIDQNMMTLIPNYQKNFDIEGEVPTEETTLYVPVTADINALQRDRYVTAIYEYSYTESDKDGMNYETRVEKHIINIRIKFLSGTPVIGSLKEPDLVLPLETVGLDIPAIQEGAFPILGGGWEIYPSETTAKNHRNGREYVNGGEPLYFFQDEYYVAYYALTRMGKTFSDPVPLHVANYQRMADVITDDNHMYINHRDNKRDPKIYIDGRSSDTNGNAITGNELDAMHDMWRIVNDPDYGQKYSEAVDGKSRDITGANGLEFFLQGEVGTTKGSWTPIGGGDKPCFAGTFHGNGNTVTGLDNSLFGSLCGSVYNLGVMGSFTAGGVANTGDGRIENAWVWTSATPSGQAVYANPGSDARVLNSYYPDANSAFTGANTAGKMEITQRPVEQFVNGSVAYDLNRYYLEGRYRLMGQQSGSVTDHVLFRLPDGTLVKTETKIADENGVQPGEEGYIDTYASKVYDLNYDDADYTRFTKTGSTERTLGYVEKYYDDGDFRFSDGKKPQKADMRLTADYGYIPVYPDDYIFFGQKLSYGLLNDAGGNVIQHALHPQAVAKSHTTGSDEDVDNSKHGLLVNDINDRSENRVYRAPAYYQNGVYGTSANFNARAVFVDGFDYTIDGKDYQNYPHRGMTAIDFTGGNGDTHGYQGVVAGTTTDFTNRAGGYHPLLDYERLDAFQTRGLTQNLLAYTPKADLVGSKNTQTNDVLVSYFNDPTYGETNEAYRTVGVENTTEIRGHVVQQTSTEGNYTYGALVDHLLVDRQDFNAPMPYTFAADKRMWYQRVPDRFVDLKTGWDAISIPFEAELVTTDVKGELTHFYKGNTKGHEYWLRQFEAVSAADGESVTATFNPMDAGTNEKEYTNTFLYDYYYSYDSYQDANEDQYQRAYYASAKTFSDYPYSVAGTPYLVGFPGSRYYEFDLSGTFIPQNTYSAVEQLARQTITFASATGETIAKSDTELAAKTVTKTKDGSSYSFTPNYLSQALPDGSYLLNTEGDGYAQATATGNPAAMPSAVPFRPYFTATAGAKQTRAIFFNQTDTSFGSEENDPYIDGTNSLDIYAKKGKIVVTSNLSQPATVTVATPAGIHISTFTLSPGETVTTRIRTTGVYIVATDVRIQKKLQVEGR